MPANPWELRADVRPLELAAQRWSEIGTLVARRGDEIVDAARRATEAWDAAAAESYEHHRRQVLAHLDRFTSLAGQISGSLRAISAVLTASQMELDRSWTDVALVPHDVVGESGHLVFRPEEDGQRVTVTRGQAETEEIRARLALALDQESTRLRAARAELVLVRTELTTLAGATFARGLMLGEDESGVGVIPPASTSVPGAAQSGMAGGAGTVLPPIASLSVSMPDLGGMSAAGLAPFVATAAAGLAGRSGRRAAATGVPPVGGMGVGTMGVRAGTTSRGMASGRSGSHRLAAPRLQGTSEDEAARIAREKQADKQAVTQAEKEAKRAALAEKRAERAARKAERVADRAAAARERDTTDESDHDPEPADEPDDGLREEPGTDAETDGESEAQRR